MTKTFSAKLIIKKTRLKSMSQKLWLTTIAFAVILAIPAISKAQYLETFSTPNKGYLLNCANDLTSVNWTLTPWDPTGTCQISPPNPTTDLRDPNDYFQTTVPAVMEFVDLDQEVCRESPLMNISSAGTVSMAVDLSSVGFDTDVLEGGCFGDYILVCYSVNGGAYVTMPNVVGGNPCAIIAHLFSDPTSDYAFNYTVADIDMQINLGAGKIDVQ